MFSLHCPFPSSEILTHGWLRLQVYVPIRRHLHLRFLVGMPERQLRRFIFIPFLLTLTQAEKK
jgi:hypothetical protein